MTDLSRPVSPKIPRGEARRREVLVEAARIFLRDGLDGTSMDVIAAEAGTSKATLYRHFGDKHGLVVAVVEFLCADFTVDIDRNPPPGGDLRSGLRHVLVQLVHVLSKPDHPQFFRLIVAGSARDPEIGITWNEHGPHMWHRMLAQVFSDFQHGGTLPTSLDVEACPRMLFDAIFARMIIRTAIVGPAGKDEPDPIRYIDALLDAVLAGV